MDDLAKGVADQAERRSLAVNEMRMVTELRAELASHKAQLERVEVLAIELSKTVLLLVEAIKR